MFAGFDIYVDPAHAPTPHVQNVSIRIGCLFENLGLTHEACLGITLVRLYIVLDHRRVNFLTVVRIYRKGVTLPK